MGYPQNPEILQGIYKTAFNKGVTSGDASRYYSKLSQDIPQDVTTVSYTSFGSVPEPRQLSGVAGGGTRQSKQLKDYKLAVTVQEYEVTVDMPRSVAEDNPADAQEMVGKLGGKCSFAYDRQFVGVLTSTTLLGYDGVVIYSAAHGESGTNQTNIDTTAGTPTGAQVETAITSNLGALMGFTDDQLTPVNEGVTHWTILVNPIQYFTYLSVLDPNMSQQAIDSSGGTGKFRGLFTIIPTALVASKTHYIFADAGDKAVGFFHKTAWDVKSNMYTDSDYWKISNLAMFTGYARHAFYPWNWKSTARYIFS